MLDNLTQSNIESIDGLTKTESSVIDHIEAVTPITEISAYDFLYNISNLDFNKNINANFNN